MHQYKFCICGGGALGHVMACMISSKGFEVNLLTNHPSNWDKEIYAQDLEGRKYIGHLNVISSDPKEVIPISDIILICLPGYLIDSELKKIKPYLKADAVIGSIVSSTGFFITALTVLGHNAKLFGFQRVPYIARIHEYGKQVDLLGYKKHLNVAFYNIKNPLVYQNLFESIIKIEIDILKHILEVTLTNSNPILHPTRLYCLFKDYDGEMKYPREFLFYEDWDLCSSKLLIACDTEFQNLLSTLPITKSVIPPLLDYYESYDEESLTRKIRSIQAFKGIKAPMKKVENGYIPDIESRYFTEDISYGLLLIKFFAQIQSVKTPFIDLVLDWSQKIMHKRYICNDILINDSEDVLNISCLNRDIIQKIIKH